MKEEGRERGVMKEEAVVCCIESLINPRPAKQATSNRSYNRYPSIRLECSRFGRGHLGEVGGGLGGGGDGGGGLWVSEHDRIFQS